MSHVFGSLSGRRVLIVDDSAQMASVLEDVFVGCGADVAVCNSGRDAMMRLQLETFDMVIFDLVMPSPDGWEVLGFMRQATPAMVGRTILLTGDRCRRGALRGIDDSQVHVVCKPFDIGSLRAGADVETFPALRTWFTCLPSGRLK